MIDLRSDTVTLPTAAMYAAMAQAPLGDDVYQDDPTTLKLEQKTAQLTGFEAGLFFPSGSQSNLAAMMTHCQRGEEVITGERYHVFAHEAAGASVLGGVAMHPLPTPDSGMIELDMFRAAIKEDDFHYPQSRLITLENTFNGRVIPLHYQTEVVQLARQNNLRVHLDGARLMNAAAALNAAPAKIAQDMDSLSVCLSKGLGAPVGSVLCGSIEFINKARRLRKILGGGMRQTGVLCACGLVAFEQNIDRLTQDHKHARLLAQGLAHIPGLKVDMDSVQTNMVFVEVGWPKQHNLVSYLKQNDVLVLADEKAKMRLVTHLGISEQDVAKCIKLFSQYPGKTCT